MCLYNKKKWLSCIFAKNSFVTKSPTILIKITNVYSKFMLLQQIITIFLKVMLQKNNDFSAANLFAT
jgi:hypothetical protein